MNTYLNLLKKENILLQKNQITKSSSQFKLIFFQKEKYGFFFIKKKLKNQMSTFELCYSKTRSNKNSIICSATKLQTNYLNDYSKLNNSFTLQKNKVDYRFQIYNSKKSATFSESKIQLANKVSFFCSSSSQPLRGIEAKEQMQKKEKNYNLNFLKKLNCFNFLFKNNATNKWVNWVLESKINDNLRFAAAPRKRMQSFCASKSKKLLKKNDVNVESFNKIGSFPSDLHVQRSGEVNPLNKNLYKSGYSKIHELKLVSVEIASSEKIKEWAEKVLPNGKVFGEVTNANTLHYKTFKPHKGGLFCERIFGPLRDFECACGVRSKPIELESFVNENQQKKRFFCMNCDVEYTWSVIRRYQLGYIQLISPVSHIWFLKANPSYLSLLLDFRRSHLESIIYCTESITLENLWKSSQTLGLDTSPSTLYSIWQKLLEEEKLIKRKHKEIKKIKSLFTKGSTKNITLPIYYLKQNKKRLNLMYLYANNKDLFYKTTNIMYDSIQNSFYKNKIFSNNQFYNYEKSYEKSLKLIYKKTFFQILAFTNKTFLFSHVHLKVLKILFFKDLINKLDIYNSLSSKSKSQKEILKVTKKVDSKIATCASQPLRGSECKAFDSFTERRSEKQVKEERKNLHLKKQIISNIHEKEIMQFKDNFLVLAESFFQIYFIKLYLKDKNLIIQIPNNILQLFCEFFVFYYIQIQFNFYIKKNPLNNLPKILSVNKKKKSSTYNKNNLRKSQIFYLKKIKEGNKKILKVSSKIKKGIHGTTGFFYYTGICLFKKQIKLNTFFQKNKKLHLKFPYNKETTYKINFNKKNNLFENVKLLLNSIESFNTFSSISISKSFIQNVQSKKQTNILQNLIREIHYKNDILSQQKNRKNVSDILYLLYEFYKKEMVSFTCKESLQVTSASQSLFHLAKGSEYKSFDSFAASVLRISAAEANASAAFRKTRALRSEKQTKEARIPEIEYKQDKKYSILSEIYSLNTFLNLFYVKNHKYKFSEIINCNNLINYLCKISNNLQIKFASNLRFSSSHHGVSKRSKKSKLTEKNNIKKDKILKIQSKNVINLTKNYSNLNLNKKNTLTQRKKILFLQKQKSLILRNPQFFSSIYSKKTSNNKYFTERSKFSKFYNKKSKERQYKEDWQIPLQKKMLKNDLYTISYSHLWPLNADWKSFFYYNSAPKDFEDTHIYYSYRKGNFYNKINKFNTKLDILSQIDDIIVSDSMIQGQRSTEDLKYKQIFFTEQPKSKNTYLKSYFGRQNANTQSFSLSQSEAQRTVSFESKIQKEQEAKVTKTTEFLSKMNSPLAGAAIVKKLLSEYTPSELKKMVKQHQVLLPKLNQNIRQLKEKAIKKLDFVKIQKLLNKRDHIIRRLKLIRKFSRKNVDPTSMILSVLPVLPPDLRPILKLQNQIAASDLNRLYQRIIYRNERLKKFLKDPSTSQSFEMKYAQRLLQEAVDNLIQNGKGNVKPETNSRGQALKSLSEILKGKQGRFRQYLLGKRVDYSGRSVIVVGPKLKLYECGLPKEMAIELFLPFLIKRILHYKIARTVIGAKNFLYSNKTYCINLLNEIMRNHPVLLNRAPTLHRLGIQAFQPKLVEGRAILLHPLVCPAFNADFDGDQMAVHLPITVEARAEAWTLIFSRNHLISPATGDPIVLPSQDMVLGCYYLTSEKKNIKRFQKHNKDFVNSPNQLHSGAVFHAHTKTNENTNINDKKYKHFFCISNLFNLEKVLNAYQLGKISVQSIVWIKWKGNTQFANEPLSMLEMRLNRYGIRDQIHSKSYKRIDKEENLLNQYIRTTPGRILINNIAQKCMLL
uniref:DNA-directed RNA polymerase subunit beta' n=1 Tax=Pseudopediastrum integrum TaxID=271402 RepID=A0A2U8GJG2_9CHLO|nr:beta subunit of RNA polymerase [Pseudopediastrum integrum]AWI68773.1 beta subunit of RNA polymerase [Pseudopediastrum integrum]